MFKFSGKILLSSIEKLKDPFVAIEKLDKNSIFILRDEVGFKYQHDFIKKIRSFCAKKDILFFVQNLPYAKKYKADGISLKEKDRFLRVSDKSLIICQSCHDLQTAKVAIMYKRDFIILSSLFKTTTHPKKRPLGIIKFNRILQQLDIAVVALGGIRKHNFDYLSSLDIYGFAAIDYFLYDK